MVKPYVPQISWPLGGQSFDSTEQQIFKWSLFKDPTPTDTQNGYYLEYKENVLGSTLNNSGWVVSTNSQHTFNANVFANNKQYAWRIKVRDQNSIESDFSNWVVFKTSKRPTCSITYPALDGDTIETDIVTFSHTATDQEGLPFKNYQYKLYADDGITLFWTSDLLTNYENLTVCPKGLLQNNTYYKVEVTVTDADSLSATSTKRRFYTNFPPTRSNTPDFTITAENDYSRNKLKWVNIKSIPATYVGTGERYLPATFGNGIEIKELGEKLYWDIDIPIVFCVDGIFKPNENDSGTIKYFYANSSNWMRFFYDEIGQKFIIEKCVNGEIRTTGSPTTIFNAGQSAFYHIQQKNTGHVIVHTGIRGSGILSKWGDIS